MVRCTKCRFLFEAPTRGLLPSCRQCGGPTTEVTALAPQGAPPAQPTLKFKVAER